jgi:predicted double-glycine peptidase
MQIIKKTYLLVGIIFSTIGCSQNISKPKFYNWKELKEKNIIIQQFDYSCGTGSLATLLKHYYNDPVTETELLNDVMKHLPEEVINNRKLYGLSMLDLQQVSERRGYEAIGVKLSYASLLKLDRPILVYLESKDFKHFAIYKGYREDRIFLADPSRGNIRISTDRFFKEWKNKMALILDKPGYTATNNLLEINVEFPLRAELYTVKKVVHKTR